MRDQGIFLVSLILVGVLGCRAVTPHPSPILTHRMDPAETTLAESAVSVSHSLYNMAEIERANTLKIVVLWTPSRIRSVVVSRSIGRPH